MSSDAAPADGDLDDKAIARKVHKRLLERQEQQHQGRLDAILELRANSEKAYAGMCGHNEKRNAEADALAAAQAREFQELLASGKNPYEVFRAREIEARTAAKLARQQRKIQSAEMHIATNMVREAARNQRRGEVEKRHVEYVQKYQKELGRKVVEDRTRKYMLSRVGAELVDPTGRTFRIDPSQVTTMKDYSFGTGKSTNKTREQRDKVIDAIAAKPEHADVHFNPRWIPKSKHNASSSSSSSLSNTPSTDGLLLPPISQPPGKELVQLNGLDDSSALPSLAASTASSHRTNSSSTKKGFGVPKRSKLEEAMRQRALAKQKDNLIEKQIVWRKEFTGRAFLADPPEVSFSDFDVGTPQSRSFTLTNVSNTFNHFKLLPLPDDVRDFFDIKYEKPGRMSAGMTCRVHVTFLPRRNADLETHIPAVAKTGYFSIPLRCAAKRSVPELSTSHIEFANVVVGECAKHVVTLRNAGALPTAFRILPVDTPAWRDAGDREETRVDAVADPSASEAALMAFATSFGQVQPSVSVAPPLVATTDGRVAPYASCSIHFAFSPHEPMAAFTQSFQVTFDDAPEVPPLDISVRAQAAQVPLYVETPMMDFKCCVYDKLYRGKLLLRNRGKVPLKCQLKVPKYLKEVLEFVPHFGYVQGCSPGAEPGRFEIQIKFRPTQSLWKAVSAHKFGLETLGVLAIPLQVLVPDQVLPVYFVLRAQLTLGDLEFSSRTISFGVCATTQSVAQRVRITNRSILPQKFAFVHLPPEVRVEPNDGFGTLLPYEAIDADIVFSPSAATEFHTSLTCVSSMNRTYSLPCHGTGTAPALRFSETVVTLGAIPIGQFVVHSLVCANASSSDQRLEIDLPASAAKVLRIRPLVATVPAYGSVRIEVEFRPTAWDDLAPAENVIVTKSCNAPPLAEASATINANDVALEDVTPRDELDDDNKNDVVAPLALAPTEPRSVHATYNLVCFGDDAKNKGDGRVTLQSLRLHVSIVERELLAKPETLSFGQVAVGQSSVLKLQVINDGPEELELHMLALHCMGPFSIVNALRCVAAGGGMATLFVEFTPSAPLIFQEDLMLTTARGDLRVPLHGEGVSPVLQITPPDGDIHFKPVLAREKGYTEFALLNSSQFPLKYIIKTIEVLHPNYNQTSVFSCTPNEAVIPPGETQVVRCVFSPDHERPIEFSTKFRIDVPNQTEDHVITLRGRCWESQTYLLPPTICEETAVPEDIFELPQHVLLPAFCADFVKKPPRVLQVVFDTEPTTKNVIIGSIGPQDEKDHGHSVGPAFSDGKASSAATFEVAFDGASGLAEKHRKYFAIEPSKGSVLPGHEATIAVHFNPKGDDHDIGNQLRIMHWIRVSAKVTIKGGFMPLGATEHVVHLLLKARVLT
ncbi:hypothetical protein SPRG_06072 [Saprolegnia parasitica CBS 223.65]|uniref:Abnormal spindle-like microcephaly-associated protein ASH domain-containing protein n=1 Tax=Saprolegnia parasitica (strain CBS 223.65) TaxID=695850 RepID=A0A067CQB4_SAPPC|nr:hypothetical protein SPRG_06072 [Saprolegnia parasitica CBS 223.65]KDO29017.1 hypothetical protein SPRG_06072 [Saprolegnia parasitica CBS 223.65]|eukprot:XP_012200187.1 hypothetical protein SPRG_06072 [Saprolegnia parasitica CBS 223.65]